MRQAVPQSEFLTFQHLPSMVNWYKDATTTVVTTSTDPDNIYQATGESLYEAFWRTLCCNLSGTDEIKTPTDDSGYVGWRSLIDIQERRYNMEINYRRGCELGRRLTCGFTGIAISALTYYFRQHKLLFVALPLSATVDSIRQPSLRRGAEDSAVEAVPGLHAGDYASANCPASL
jgi:hypothetical protein